jgi:hypothetical protein
MYFDSWFPMYFWPGLRVCYCDGCRSGFRKAAGEELPYHEKRAGYTAAELATIARYHGWYRDRIAEIFAQTRKLVKSYKDIPLITNINNPQILASRDPRIAAGMDAFLYERGETMVHRAEGVSLARAAGFGVWPYVGGYHNWPRVAFQGFDYSQEIFTTVMFGGAPIVAQPTGYVDHKENRRYVAEPFALLAQHEDDIAGFENVPYAAVVYGEKDPPGHAKSGWWWKADTRTASLGAFAACLHRHVQVTSALNRILDNPQALARYKVLYLADETSLAPQRVENVKEFVRNGGGLVAGYATSLYDEKGARQERFALEELLRVRPLEQKGALAELIYTYGTILGGPNDMYMLARPGNGLLGAGWNGRLVPAWFFEPVEALPGGTVVMDIVTGDGRRPVLPAVVVSRYGKGRVIYSASSIESLFAGNNEYVLGDLVRDLALAAAPEPPPYEVDAPAGVIVNLTQKGTRRVLHLTNWTGDKLEKTHLSAYYLAPVENVRIRVKGKAAAVRSYPAKGLVTGAAGWTLPRLGNYQAVTWSAAP